MTDALQEAAEVTKTGVDMTLDTAELEGYGDPIADNTWLLAEDMPGEGDVPEWFDKNKYKTVMEQAKAYPEARKMVGDSRAPAEYKIDELPEEFKDFQFDENALKSFQEMGKKYNLSNQAYNATLRAYMEDQASQLAQVEKAEQEYIADQMKELGPNAENMINDLKNKMEARLPEEVAKTLQTYADSAEFIKAISQVVDMLGDRRILPSLEPSAPTDEDRRIVREAMGTREYLSNPAYQKEVDDKAKRLYGG